MYGGIVEWVIVVEEGIEGLLSGLVCTAGEVPGYVCAR